MIAERGIVRMISVSSKILPTTVAGAFLVVLSSAAFAQVPMPKAGSKPDHTAFSPAFSRDFELGDKPRTGDDTADNEGAVLNGGKPRPTRQGAPDAR